MKSKFWKFYRIMILVLLLISICVWTILWFFLDSYEKGTPENYIKNVVSLFNDKKYNDIASKVVVENKDVYGEKTISIMLKDVLKSKYDYRVKNKNKNIYSIIDKDKKEVAEVTLKVSKKNGMFKTKIWDVESIKGILGKSSDITIDVPIDSKVYINNKIVGNDRIKENDVVPSKLENVKEVVETPLHQYYLINGIYPNTKVEVKYNDKKIELSNEENIYSYKYLEDEKLLNSVKPRMNSIVENYTRYVVAEQGFGSLSPYLVRNTKAYTFLSKIASTNLWSGNHTRSVLSEIEYKNMEVYNENVFVVDASYSYSYTVYSGKKDFDSTITLYMIKKDNNWYLGDLNT